MSALALPDIAAPLPDSSPLQLYDSACRAIAAAKSVDEVKNIRDKSEALRACARVAKNRQLEIDAAEIRIRAERRLGELIIIGKEAGQIAEGRPPKNCTDEERFPRVRLEDAGIDRKLSARSQRYAALPEVEFEGLVDAWRESLEEMDSRITTDPLKVVPHFRTLGTGLNEWFTPAEYIELARQVLGEIDLDPATCEAA
jgi:hypothetical protein